MKKEVPTVKKEVPVVKKEVPVVQVGEIWQDLEELNRFQKVSFRRVLGVEDKKILCYKCTEVGEPDPRRKPTRIDIMRFRPEIKNGFKKQG